MSTFTFITDNTVGSTTVSNQFIDLYMKEANEAQLKIYLYLLRMKSSNLPTGISDIADQFNYMETDVIRALKYWERKNVLALEHDQAGNVTGIRFVDLSIKRPVSMSIEAAPSVQADSSATSMGDREPAIVAEANEDDLEKPKYEKPPYSANQLKMFKECAEAQDIIFIAETYLQKQLTRRDLESLFFIFDELHFSTELIDSLIQYCVQHGKKDFRYIETVAIGWLEEGINTPQKAAEMVKRREKVVYSIMKSLGKFNVPSSIEMKFIDKWTKEYQFQLEVITEACNRTVLATENNRFQYADRILEKWHQADVHNMTDIKMADMAFERQKTSKKESGKASSATALYNQFPQNQYDYDALEKELLSN